MSEKKINSDLKKGEKKSESGKNQE